MTNLVTQTEFAKIIGNDKGYVTQLKQRGRLVMEDGKVNVEKSRERIQQTSDPAKNRHSDDELNSKVGSAYQQARAMKEKYSAMQAKMSYEQKVGELVTVQEAKLAVMDGDTIIRNRLEAMPDILAPQLAAESDEHKIRSIIIDQVEYLLNDLSQTFKKISHE